MKFADRREAGRVLGAALSRYGGRPDVMVLALPRGGVPVAYEVARALDAPLDVFLARKALVPGEEGLSLATVASGGVIIVDRDVVEILGIDPSQLQRIIAREVRELHRREHEYRIGNLPLDVKGLTVILVDDGLMTGGQMCSAARALRRLDPSRIICAVPVASHAACQDVRGEVDDLICLATPAPFHAVGVWYTDFAQVDDRQAHQFFEERRALHTGGRL